MVPRAEEGRGKTAKRPGERSSARSPGCPNGETQSAVEADYSWGWNSGGGTGGSETSQYPEEKEANAMPSVAASEMGGA